MSHTRLFASAEATAAQLQHVDTIPVPFECERLSRRHHPVNPAGGGSRQHRFDPAPVTADPDAGLHAPGLCQQLIQGIGHKFGNCTSSDVCEPQRAGRSQ